MESESQSFVLTECQVEGAPPFLLATESGASDDFQQGIREGRHLTPTVKYAVAMLARGDTFVDVGANIGTYSIPVGLKGCRVLAVEALAENYLLLCEAAKQNGLQDFTPVHAAAYSRGGFVQLIGASAWGTVTDGPGTPTPAVRMDELLLANDYEVIDLMKIDVEGSELAVLEGLGRAINRVRSMIVEVNEPACRAAGYTGVDLLKVLERGGFHLYMFYDHTLVPRRATDFRELYNCDFLAVRGAIKNGLAGFRVGALPTELSIALALSQADSEFDSPRQYFSDVLPMAPDEIRNDARIVRAAARLRETPDARAGSSPAEVPSRFPRLVGSAENRSVVVLAPGASSCGVASYARMMHANLQRYGFDATLLPLDDELLQQTGRGYGRLSEAHLSEVCRSLRGYDVVNFHFELGTLGGPKHGVSRFKRLLEASREVVLDFHTLGRPRRMRYTRVLELIASRRSASVKAWKLEKKFQDAWLEVYAAVRRAQQEKRVRVAVHTEDDAAYLRDIVGIDDVTHHPLAYMDAIEAAELAGNRAAVRAELGAEFSFHPKASFLLGFFGFLSFHKGVEHAVRSLVHQPPAVKLLIFGQVHPRSRPTGPTIDSYVAALVTLVKELELEDRVYFAGDRDDAGFKKAISAVDLAIFPYLEVGQRSSGPIQMAVELGVPIACTPTKCFDALAKYYPDRFHFFDAGNDLRLARIVDASRSGFYRRNWPYPGEGPNARSMARQFASFFDRPPVA